MIENKNNLVLILFVLIVVLFANNLLMTKRVTNNVIQQLKREYVPGPYTPGFDPDKVPPTTFQ